MLWIDLKYVGLISGRLSRFKRQSDASFNFRCPYCGDSNKNKSKARGYLFVIKDIVLYKCHNCTISTSLFKFLEYLDVSLANAYKLEKFSKAQTNTTIKSIPLIQLNQIKNPLEDIDLIKLSNLNDGHSAISYMQTRNIPREKYSDLYYARDVRVLEKLNPIYKNRIISEERIVIPFYDKTGNISGVSARAMGNSNLRYLNIRITDYPMIYGIPNLDITKQILVTEGAFDSMFLDNAIAVNGSDLSRSIMLFPKKNMTLIFDNQPRNKQLVRIIEKMIYFDWRIMIWPDSFKYKDINEAINSGITRKEIMYIINRNSRVGLALKLAIRDWKKT